MCAGVAWHGLRNIGGLRDAWMDEFRARARVLHAVGRVRVRVVDMLQILKATGEPRGFYVDQASHFNERGYAEAAHAVLDQLNSGS